MNRKCNEKDEIEIEGLKRLTRLNGVEWIEWIELDLEQSWK